jgi:uncharacterized protein YlxW (UPF0749 family)
VTSHRRPSRKAAVDREERAARRRLGDSVDHSPGYDDTESILQVTMTAITVDDYADTAAHGAGADSPGPNGPGSDGAGSNGAAARRTWPAKSGYAIALLAVGLVATIAVVQSQQDRPALAAEQAALVDRVRAETALSDDLSRQSQALTAEVAALRAGQLGPSDQVVADRIHRLELLAGAVAVSGPGIVIKVDDAPPAKVTGEEPDPSGRVLDIDLQHLVNGLWAAGAEAVSINGQRLTATTAIRSAGQAITVDYRPLARPYVVSAIGDPKTLAGRYSESDGGMWMLNLASTHGVVYSVDTRTVMTLPGDTATVLRYARPLAQTEPDGRATPKPSPGDDSGSGP